MEKEEVLDIAPIESLEIISIGSDSSDDLTVVF